MKRSLTAALAIVGAIANPLSAQTKPLITPKDFGKWELLSAARLSPRGDWVAANVNRVSEEKVASIVGEPLARADAEFVREATGYVIGGISPFGQRKRLPTVVDTSALGWDKVLCSAGKRGWDVALHPQDLIALTNAVTADIRA